MTFIIVTSKYLVTIVKLKEIESLPEFMMVHRCNYDSDQ